MPTWETPYAFSAAFICTFGANFSGPDFKNQVSTLSDLTWTANLAVYLPFVLYAPFCVHRFSVAVGASVANIDAGIYTTEGIRLTAIGGVASTHNSTLQYAAATPADVLLEPGSYYLGFASSGTTTTVFGSAATATQLAAVGCKEQATAYPLPATATFAAITHALYPIVGVAQV